MNESRWGKIGQPENDYLEQSANFTSGQGSGSRWNSEPLKSQITQNQGFRNLSRRVSKRNSVIYHLSLPILEA